MRGDGAMRATKFRGVRCVVSPPDGCFFVSVHSKEVEVLCFDTVSQVFILHGLRRVSVTQVVASRGGCTIGYGVSIVRVIVRYETGRGD